MKKRLKRFLGGLLAAVMAFDLAGGYLPALPGGTVQAAEKLEMPEGPPVPVFNKDLTVEVDKMIARNAHKISYQYAFLWFYGYNLAGNFTWRPQESDWSYVYYQYSPMNLESANTRSAGGTSSSNTRDWYALFAWNDFDPEAFPEGYIWDDISVKFGMYGFNDYRSSKIYVGQTKEERYGGGYYTWDEFSTPWTKLYDHRRPTAVVSGYGSGACGRNSWYLMADMVSPGEVTEDDPSPWEVVVTEDSEKYGGRPVVWLCEKETMRPANANITTADLSSLRIKLGLVPKDEPDAEVTYVTARAMAFENGLEAANNKGGAIGFQIGDAMGDREYQIVSVEDQSQKRTYDLYVYQKYQYQESGFVRTVEQTVSTPVTDLAGNPVVIMGDGRKNLRSKALFLDSKKPEATRVLLSGTNVDVSAQTMPEDWPEDIDRTKLFSKVGDTIQFRVQLSEKIAPLTAAEKENLTLYLDLTDKDGRQIARKLVSVEDSYADGANAEPVSVLVFEPYYRITSGLKVQGARIRAAYIAGADSLRDLSGNHAAADSGGNLDLSSYMPNAQNYLDTEGPKAEVTGPTVVADTAAEKEYLYEIRIRDGNGDDGVYAGTTAGELAMISDDGIEPIEYEYTFSTSPETSGQCDGESTIVGSGNNSVWNQIAVPKDGTYYCRLKIKNLEGKELKNNGIKLYLRLTDAIGNAAESIRALNEICIDNKLPALSVKASGVRYSSGGGSGENSAELSARVDASDLNGIRNNEVLYQWLDPGTEPAEDGWQSCKLNGNNLVFNAVGSGKVTKELVVKVYDNNGNFSEERLEMSVDLSRTAVNCEVASDISQPDAAPKILIGRPQWDEEAFPEVTKAYTRAILTMGNQTYVRVFDSESEAEANLFDTASENWYKVDMANDGGYWYYRNVYPGEKPDWSYYGEITVQLNTSVQDLTPQKGAVYDQTDTSYSQDVFMTVQYAPHQDNLYQIWFEGVQDSAGTTLNMEYLKSGKDVYRFDRTMTGSRFGFTISNTKRGDWGTKGLDLDNSYALIVKTDKDGNVIYGADGVPAEENWVTDKVLLSDSKKQWVSVPERDRNGQELTTGAYTLWVHIVQKSGGGQNFCLASPGSGMTGVTKSTYLLLDAGKIPQNLGMHSVRGDIPTTEATSGWIESVQPSDADTKILNIGVAEPGNAEAVAYAGHTVGVGETMNTLQSSPIERLEVRAELSESDGASTWLGEPLGMVSGIKIWNGAAKGDPKDLPYVTKNGGGVRFGTDENAAILDPLARLRWYDGEEGIVEDVSGLSIQEAGNGSLKFTMGANTICYQLELENGTESPVYQTQVNLSAEEPDLELEYSFGRLKSGEDGKSYAAYADVTVANAFSPNGGVTVYHGYRDERNSWSYEEITDWNEPIRISANQNGELGVKGTNGSGNLNIREYFCAVDSMGNAKTIYPAFHEGASDTEYYGIAETTPMLSASAANDNLGGYTVTVGLSNSAAWENIGEYLNRLTVQIDGGASVDALALEDMTENSAGISSVARNVNSYGTNQTAFEISGEFPYDPTQEEGVMVDHTITVAAAGGFGVTSDGTDDGRSLVQTFTVSAPNTKPTLSQWFDEEQTQAGVTLTSDKYTKIEGYTTDAEYRKFHTLPVYENKTLDIKYRDLYGESYETQLEITGLSDSIRVSISPEEITQDPVTVTVSSDVYQLSLEDAEDGWKVTGDGSGELKVTVSENTALFVAYSDGAGNEGIRRIDVQNIFSSEIKPELRWEGTTGGPVGEEVKYYGDMTVYVIDANGSTLTDPQTGEIPQFVFSPGGPTSYTFSGYVNQYGITGPDITAELPDELLPYPSDSETDETPPEVGITGYRVHQDVPSSAGAAFELRYEDRPEAGSLLPDYTQQYGEENVFTDMDALIKRLGWAQSYRLQIEIGDESAVRLFVKSDQDGAAPGYDGKSDQIEGVTLAGRSLSITQNASFILYAVDEAGNSSRIPVNITALGDAPQPEYAQVLTKGGGEVRVYLLPPNVDGVTELQITDTGAATDDGAQSSFAGYQYLSFTENGPATVHYSYLYNGTAVTGEIRTEITGINNQPPVAGEVKWSANHSMEATNQEVSAQTAFSRSLAEVYPIDGNGNRIAVPDGVTVSFLENKVTAIYMQNAPALTLRAVAAGRTDLMGVVELAAVENIDTAAPTVEHQIEYSSNRRQAVVTFTASEEVIFREGGKRGIAFSAVVKENGVHTWHFSDVAGNAVEVTAKIGDVIEDDLTLEVASKVDDSAAIDPETYEIRIGDTLYVKVNRDARVCFNGKENLEASGVQALQGQWTAVTVTED